MANLIIPAASAGIGYLVGGPTGAQVGWMVGSTIQGSRQTIRQDSVGDLRIQTAQYGIPIPYVLGKQRVAGNIIWASEKKKYEIKTKTGKGGGPTVITTGYKQDMAILLCKGTIAGVVRMWANNKLIVDGTPETRLLPCKVYRGTQAQMPDVTMEAALGVGNVPAYRGLAYVVIKDFDLGTSGAVPNFSFEVYGPTGF